MSPPPEKPTFESGHAGTFSPAEYSPEERSCLLKLAHESILAAFHNRSISAAPPFPHLAESRGAFTTLYFRGELRGCVGYVYPVSPLYITVAETARAAAFDDARFHPVTQEEASHIEVSLSVLSVPRQIDPKDIHIGLHGLLISDRGRRGLLLPQVPVEHGWDVPTFLEQTCRKAGLPPDAWQKGAMVEAFTAEVFSDHDESSPVVTRAQISAS